METVKFDSLIEKANTPPPRSATREQAYAAIDSEREYQDALWPQDNSPGFPNPLTIGEFILLAEEYVAKARLAWTQEKKPEMTAVNALRKVAGICVNCMEQHGAPHRSAEELKAARDSVRGTSMWAALHGESSHASKHSDPTRSASSLP